MADGVVYTDPGEPGAPVVGDVVVGLYREGDPVGPPGVLRRLDPECPNGLRWYLGTEWAWRVRRPTPEELVAYHLGAS